jgi:hypothetical protein
VTNVSDYPVTVDGRRLDDLALGLETSSLTLGGLRSADQPLSGLDGEVPSLNDAREPGLFTMGMMVRGNDANGVVTPGVKAQTIYQENLNVLKHLLCQQGALRDVRRVVNPAASLILGTAVAAASTDQQVLAKVVDSISPDDAAGDWGRVVSVLKVPGCYWRSVQYLTFTQAAVVSGTDYEHTGLAGSTAPIEDAVVTLVGPANAGVTITDTATGYGVRLNEALPAGQTWRVNADTWESRVGAGLTVDSADTAGTDKSGVTDQTGTYPRYLRLHPRDTAGARRVKVRVTGGGFTAATTLAVKARRAYL